MAGMRPGNQATLYSVNENIGLQEGEVTCPEITGSLVVAEPRPEAELESHRSRLENKVENHPRATER